MQKPRNSLKLYKYFPAIIVILFDQLSKLHIVYNYNLYDSKLIFKDIIKFTYVENPGVAFGINLGKNMNLVLFSISFLIIILMILYIQKLDSQNKLFITGISLIIGGAIGNFIDRVATVLSPLFLSNKKGVVDFIDIGYGTFRWFTFNVADIAITLGAIIYIYLSNEESDRLQNL